MRKIYYLGFAALFFTHLFALSQVAGWHVDEAWGANFAYRIAFEPHFWPIQAMSPYTAAWSHYFAALAFKIFGASVFVYRFAGMLFVFLGVALISLGLKNFGERKAANLFPLVVALFPSLVMNHRWVIEMNTFFVFCGGLVFLGLSRIEKRWGRALLALGAVLGMNSHVLFIAPCLALWIFLFLTDSLIGARAKFLVTGITLCVMPFFLNIFFTTSGEDHRKALELIAVCLLVLILQWLPIRLSSLKNKIFVFFWLVSLPLLIPFFLFLEGSWLALFSSGELQTRLLIGTFFLPIFLLFFFYFRSGKKLTPADFSFLPLCLLLTQLMVVKPGPRYYEIPFLFVAGVLAMAASRLRPKQLAGVGILWSVLGALQLGVNYFQPDLRQLQLARTFRLGRFHDSSVDMLPTQRLAVRLAKEGCRYEDLQLTDDRLNECMRFLAHGDWPKLAQPVCRLGSGIDIQRKGLETQRVGAISEGQFWLLGHVDTPKKSPTPVKGPGQFFQSSDWLTGYGGT
jgi:hypothetical protein